MTLALFALNASRPFGDAVARALGRELAAHEEREFEDGEHKARPLESVRGRDVYVVQSLHGDPRQSANDKLVRLLFFLGAVRDAGAGRVTALVPYLCYARKDRKTKSRDPVTTRYVAGLFEAVGVDRVVTLDVHNLAAYQNAFRIATENLEARELFAAHSLGRAEELAVVSPDVGGVKRAEAFRQALEARLDRPVAAGFMEKHRSAGRVSGEILVAEVTDRTVLLIDDLIASGTTLVRAARACLERGAERVIGLASHGAFADRANETLAEPALDRLVITDTIPPERITAAAVRGKLEVVSAAPLFAEAVRRLHEDGSIVELLESGPAAPGR
jgi:ribose-phosphate pyrophosphokinase